MIKQDNINQLKEIYKTLLPSLYEQHITQSSNQLLSENCEDDSLKSHLDLYCLYKLTDLLIDEQIEKKDYANYINKQFQTLLSAAYSEGVTVSTIVASKNSKISVYIALKATNKEDLEKKEFLFSLIKGVLPHNYSENNSNIKFAELLKDAKYSGVITGVPALKNEDGKHTFNISSVVRSMYGRDFCIVIESEPITTGVLISTKKTISKIINTCHTLAKVTYSEDNSSSKTKATNIKHKTISECYTKTNNDFDEDGDVCSSNTSGTTYTNIVPTTTTSLGSSKNFEKLNVTAQELEQIAELLYQRLNAGLNVGYWATSISYSTNDELSCKILGGSFVGELSKPAETIYPQRCFMAELPNEELIFIPKVEHTSTVFPKTLSTYLSSTELALIASPPIESLPGYEIKKIPQLALSDTVSQGEYKIGKIIDKGLPLDDVALTISKSDLNKHLFICGSTGSGKTTTMRQILKSLVTTNDENRVPFMVIESAKRDYRQLKHDEAFREGIKIYTIGNSKLNPLRLNPFYLMPEVDLLSHIDNVKAIFNASFSMYGPMPHILEKCIYNIYQNKGWDINTGTHPNFLDNKGKYTDETRYKTEEHKYCFPTLSDLKNEINRYVSEDLAYKGELSDNIRTAIIVRLESLCVGAKGDMFNTYDFDSIEELLKENNILEMEYLADDDDKAFFVGLMLTFISEYRQKYNPAVNIHASKGLQHFLVIEEAHRLLKNVSTEKNSEQSGNPKGKAVETFCNIIAEMRSAGQGVAVVEQIPTKISPDVIKNSNTKIIHRLTSEDDQEFVSASLSISKDSARYLNQLTVGRALCHKEGMERPVECVIDNNVNVGCCTDSAIIRRDKSEPITEIDYQLATQTIYTLLLTCDSGPSFGKVNEFLRDCEISKSRFMQATLATLSDKNKWGQKCKYIDNSNVIIESWFDKPSDDNTKKFFKLLSDTWSIKDNVDESIYKYVEKCFNDSRNKREYISTLLLPQSNKYKEKILLLKLSKK